MTKFHYKLILFAASLLTQCTGKKVIPDAVNYRVTVTKISKANDPKAGYDTVWFVVSPSSRNVVVDIERDHNYYYNPVVIKITSNYLVLDRSSYNGGNELRLVALAYGKAFLSEAVTYANFNSTGSGSGTGTGSGSGSGSISTGKILFRTADKWVLWDMANKKVLYSNTNTSLNIVDYNPNLGLYLVKDGNYFYYYSEDFTAQSKIYGGSYVYYSEDVAFAGINKAISFNDNYFYYSSIFDNNGIFKYDNIYNFYSCHHICNSTNSITNRLNSYIYGSYYYLVFNGSAVKYNSAYPYKALEISNSAQYLTYNLNGYLNLYTTGNNTSMQLSYIGSGNRGCFNNNSTQLAYIYYYKLNVYDIKSSSITDPLYGTTFSNLNIYEAYW